MNSPIRTVPRGSGLGGVNGSRGGWGHRAADLRKMIKIRHKPVGCAVARSHRASPDLRKVPQDREATRGRPGGPHCYEPHRIDSPDSL